ncbi:DUF721 domain-containing protein [Melioribacteraceae bacterium 4301-Me]|uniref:DUF721 domain-containing protein n=1 Tax=Pyranulibacter aquaticus TaxID=3163344 RepID=UPI00359B49C4
MFSKFKSISEVLDKEKDFEGIRKFMRNFSVVEDFPKIFPELKKIVKAVKVSRGILYIKTENSIWRSELSFKKNLMIEKINRYYNENIITSIRFL